MHNYIDDGLQFQVKSQQQNKKSFTEKISF